MHEIIIAFISIKCKTGGHLICEADIKFPEEENILQIEQMAINYNSNGNVIYPTLFANVSRPLL